MVPMLFNSKQWHTQQQENGLRLESSNWFSFRFHSDSLAKFDQQLTRRWEKLPLFLWNPFTFDVNKRRKSSLVLSVESAAFCEKSSPPLRIAVWFFFIWLLSLWNIRNCVLSYCLSIGFTCVLFVFQNEKFKNHRKHFWDGNRVGKESVRINLRINFRSMKHLLR